MQNHSYRDSSGVSAGIRGHGFRPAFLDQATDIAYQSCFANGRAAPVHVLDGLPDELVLERNRQGKVTTVKEGIIAGFYGTTSFVPGDKPPWRSPIDALSVISGRIGHEPCLISVVSQAATLLPWSSRYSSAAHTWQLAQQCRQSGDIRCAEMLHEMLRDGNAIDLPHTLQQIFP